MGRKQRFTPCWLGGVQLFAFKETSLKPTGLALGLDQCNEYQESLYGAVKVLIYLSRWLVVFLCWYHLAGVPVVEARDRPWMEYRSSHFVVYSDRDPQEARALVADFERFRRAALYLTGLKPSAETTPSQIYLFARPQDYSAIAPAADVAGFYRDTGLGPRMVVGAEAQLADASLVLFHEYVHHLVRERSDWRYPIWYDEGFAELLGSARLTRDRVELGHMHPWREPLLRGSARLSLQDLLEPSFEQTEEPRYWERYYTSAWLWLHYLQLGHLAGESDYRAATQEFLLALDAGQPVAEAFKEAYGASIATFDQRLTRYQRRPRWRGYGLAMPAYQGRISQRALHKNEVAYLLGDLAFQVGRPEAAVPFLTAVDASEASVARPLSLRAVIENHQQRPALARHFLSLALSKQPEDPYVLTNAARVHWQNRAGAVTEAPKPDERADPAHEALQFAQRAVQQQPNNLDALRILWRAQRALGQLEAAEASMLAAHRQRPGDVRLNMDIGTFLANSDRPERAAPFLQKVLLWDHSAARKHRAKQLLSHLGEDASPDLALHPLASGHLLQIRRAPAH